MVILDEQVELFFFNHFYKHSLITSRIHSFYLSPRIEEEMISKSFNSRKFDVNKSCTRNQIAILISPINVQSNHFIVFK